MDLYVHCRYKRELIIYAHVMIHLSKTFGKQIPDLELVLYTNDEPDRAASQGAPPTPQFRQVFSL
jgi:hypothetical protein